MPLQLNQYPYMEGSTNGDVTPDEDAAFYNFVVKASTMITTVTVSQAGSNRLLVSDGMGVVYGRQFIVQAETLVIPVSSSGAMQGRLIIRIDLGNADLPISFVKQVAAILPDLVQEDLINGGTVFEVPLATYTVGETLISNLQNVSFIKENLMYADTYDPNRRKLDIFAYIDNAIRSLHPVGSYYIGSAATNPATLFGFGTWVRASIGKALIGVDDSDTDFNAAGKTGGAKTVTLAAGQTPIRPHTHPIPALQGSTAVSGAHVHTLQPGYFETQLPTGASGAAVLRLGSSVTTSEAGLHAHMVDIAASTTGEATAIGAAHQNMPPFETVYIWKRTA